MSYRQSLVLHLSFLLPFSSSFLSKKILVQASRANPGLEQFGKM